MEGSYFLDDEFRARLNYHPIPDFKEWEEKPQKHTITIFNPPNTPKRWKKKKKRLRKKWAKRYTEIIEIPYASLTIVHKDFEVDTAEMLVKKVTPAILLEESELVRRKLNETRNRYILDDLYGNWSNGHENQSYEDRQRLDQVRGDEPDEG